MDARAQSGENELGDRDEDATYALVADTENLFAVCDTLDVLGIGRGLTGDDYVVDIIWRTPLGEIIVDSVDVVDV